MGIEEKTPVVYQALWNAYYQQSKRINHRKAAKKAGCSMEIAALAYEDGWEEFSWATPIRDKLRSSTADIRNHIEITEEIVQRLLADPDVLSRLRAEVRKEAYTLAMADLEQTKDSDIKIKEKIRRQTQKVREEEVEYASMMRMRAKVGLVGIGQAQMEFARLGETLGRRFKMFNDMSDKELANTDPHEILSLITRYMDVQLQLGQLMQMAQSIDRKAAGDADVVIEHRGEMTVEEAERTLSNAANLELYNHPVQPKHEPN